MLLATSLALLLNTPYVSTGLPTFVYNVPTGGGGLYNAHCESTNVPPSSLAIVVNVNGSAAYTAPTLSPTQSSLQFKTRLSLSDADSVAIVLSSAGAIDNALNTLKTTCTLGQGAN